MVFRAAHRVIRLNNHVLGHRESSVSLFSISCISYLSTDYIGSCLMFSRTLPYRIPGRYSMECSHPGPQSSMGCQGWQGPHSTCREAIPVQGGDVTDVLVLLAVFWVVLTYSSLGGFHVLGWDAVTGTQMPDASLDALGPSAQAASAAPGGLWSPAGPL